MITENLYYIISAVFGFTMCTVIVTMRRLEHKWLVKLGPEDLFVTCALTLVFSPLWPLFVVGTPIYCLITWILVWACHIKEKEAE